MDFTLITLLSTLLGLSAAIEAYRHGAHVTIIDKEKNLGGNSAKVWNDIVYICVSVH